MIAGHEHLNDPDFWYNAEVGDLQKELTSLEAIADPTRFQIKRMNLLRGRLMEARRDAEQIAALNRKWQQGIEGAVKPYAVLDPETSAELFPPETTPTIPEGTVCSFCGNPVDQITATLGKGKTRFTRVMDVEIVDGIPTPVEHFKVTVPDVIACPNCCGMVKKPVIVSRF